MIREFTTTLAPTATVAPYTLAQLEEQYSIACANVEFAAREMNKHTIDEGYTYEQWEAYVDEWRDAEIVKGEIYRQMEALHLAAAHAANGNQPARRSRRLDWNPDTNPWRVDDKTPIMTREYRTINNND